MPQPPHNLAANARSDHRHSPPFLRRTTAHTLPDFLLTALSLFLLFSSSSSSSSSKIPPFSFPFYPRRFPKFPSMSICPQSRKSPKLKFATPQALSDYLKPRLPSDSFSSWGVKPGTKNLQNLWIELSEGETSLESDSNSDHSLPLRTLNVVSLRILSPNFGSDSLVLVEFKQELSDGSVRERGRFLSEKMKPGECPEDAAVRAVREELGEGAVVRVVEGSYKMRVEERESASYPGLRACYVMHIFDAEAVEGLPSDEEFWTEEEGESDVGEKAVKVRRHCWKWVRADSLEV